MGMAASQARFLGLTARKSNTEYEGQQVNQQRTALANESASLYSKLTNLSVPTPPDITDYYSTEYTFTVNGEEYTMTALPVRSENGYTISVSQTVEEAAYKTLGVEDLGFDPAALTPAQVALSERPELAKHMANEGIDVSDTTQLVNIYNQNSNWYYEMGGKYFQYTPNQVVKNAIYTGAAISFNNETGDIDSISQEQLTGGKTISVSTNMVADDSAYDAAMNTYRKEYTEYEKTMAAINAKTEVLQQQDKTLELRLNQLDTEQNAISTEMDAVQKVIEKNVESTFKTFA